MKTTPATVTRNGMDCFHPSLNIDINKAGFANLKILTLNYEFGDFEEFELTVVNDQVVNLFHISSQTTYEFTGRAFIQILRDGKASNPNVKNEERKRTKIIRKKKKRFKS